MLRITGLDAYYGQFHVLKGIDMDVAAGEVAVLLGPNGHGKSTLLKAICGLADRVVGSIRHQGMEINAMTAEKRVDRGIAYITETPELFPQMTVLENLRLGAFSPSARPFEKENLDRVFSLFPRLAERKKQMAATLSGGEARMLAVARGLMSNADFLCVDEPCLGLQPNLRIEVLGLIRQINGQGKTILLVEQHIPQIQEMADRLYVLEEGRITFRGNRDDALANDHLKEIFLGM